MGDIHLSRPVFTEEMKEAAVDALENEYFVMGESVYKFEEELARYTGTKYAISIKYSQRQHLSLQQQTQ